MTKESPTGRSLSRPGLFVLTAILAGIFWVSSLMSRSQSAPGQTPLTNIQHVETLRKQFNRDVGTTRLILLVAPT